MKPINCWEQNQHTEEVQMFIKRNSCHITQDTLTSNRTVDNVLVAAGPTTRDKPTPGIISEHSTYFY